ncbi:serine-rich adhesin for platelets-like, partial [Physella acuta]|uniref:serine-rich adhesin for platelets-like n=1 Tax=Physella acuta TaxID=109671 RepID=UPI0027DBEBCF
QLKKAKTIKTGPDLDRRVGVSNSVRSALTAHSEDSNPALSHYSHSSYDRTLGHHDKGLTTKPATSPSLPHQGLRSSVHSDAALTHGSYEDGYTPKTDGSIPKTDPLIDESSRVLEEVRARLENRRASFNPDVKISLSSAHSDGQPEVTPSSVFTPRSDGVFRFPDSAAGSRPSVSDTTRRESLGSEKYRESRQQILESSGYVKRQSLTPDTVRQSLTPDTIRQSLNHDNVRQSSPQNSPQPVESFKKTSIMTSQQENHTTGNDERMSVDRTRQHDDRLGLTQHHTNSLVQVDNKGSYSAHKDTNGKLLASDFNDFSKLTTEVRSDQVELTRPSADEIRLGLGLSAVTPQRSSEPMRSVQLIHAITDNFSKMGNYLDKMEGQVEGSRVTRTQSLHSHVRHELPPSVDLRTDVTVHSTKEAISDLSGNQHTGEVVQGHMSVLPAMTAPPECQDISKLAIESEQSDVSSDVDYRDPGEGLVPETDSPTETVEPKTTLSRGRPVGRSLTESRLSRPDRFRPDFTVLDKIDETSESSKPGAPRARRVAVAMPGVESTLETEFNSRTGDTGDRTGQASSEVTGHHDELTGHPDELTSHPDEPAPSPWHHDYSIHQAEAADQLADLDSRKPVNQEALAARRMRFSAPVYGLSPNLQLLDAAADDTQPKRRHSEIYNKMEAARIEQAFSSLLDDLDKISNSEGTVSDIDLSDNDDILALSDGSSGSCASTPHRPKQTSTSLPTGNESPMKNSHHDVVPSEDIDVTDSIFNLDQLAVTTVLDSTPRDHQDTQKQAVTPEVTLKPTSMTDTVPSGDIVVSLEDTFTGHSVKEDVELTPVVSPGSSLPSPVAQHSVSAVDHTSTMTGENSIEPGSKTMDTDAEVINNNNIVMKSTSTLQLVTAPQPTPHPAPGVRTFHVNKEEDGTITMQAGAADENQNRVITVRTKKQRTPSNADEELKDKIVKKTMVSPGGAVIEETGVVHTKKRITSRGSNYFTRREYTTRTRRDKEGGETVEHDVTVETDNKSVSQGQSWGDKVVTRVNLEDAKTVNGLSSVQSVDDLPFADEEDTPAEAIPRPEVASSNKQLHLTGPPEVSQALKDMDALEGRQVVLECRIKFPDTPHIIWFKDGQELTEADLYIGRYDELTGRATLTIPDATTFDTALYTCVGQNQVGEARTQCRVVIKRRPDNVPVFERGLCDVTVAEGNSVLLSCHVTGATSVTWQKNGVPQKHSQDARQSFDGREARLEMSDVYVDDAGLYSCLAQNEAGVQTSSCELIVKASGSESTVVPMFLTKLTNATVYDGESLILECEVVGSPEPNVFWLKDGKDLPQDLSFSTAYDGRQANLDLTGLRAEDAGRYTCVAENSGGKVTQDVFVTVQVTTPPSFTCSLQDVTTTPGKGVLLRCEVSGVPQPTVAWKKNGAMLGMTNNYIHSYNNGVARLEVLATGVEDSGRYECVARNVVGERSCGCVLTVQALKAVETRAPQEEQVTVAPPQVRRVFKKLSDPTPVSIISSMLQKAETKPADVTSTLPRPAGLISTLPRPADVISTLHKPADVTATLHKPADVTSTLPRPADVTSTLHKPADVTATLHKPADVTSTLPRPADVTSTLHKPADVTATLHKPADVTSTLPRPADVTSTLPRPADVTSTLPKPADVTSTLHKPVDVTSTLHKPADVTPDLPRAEPKPADIITSVLKRASTVQRSHTFTPGSRTFQQSTVEVSREKVDNSGLQQPERIVAPQPVGVVRTTTSMTTQSTTARDTSGADNRVLASAASLELKKHEAPPVSLTFSPSPAPRATNLSRSVSLHVVRTSATSPENSSPGVKPGKSPSRESIAKAGSLEVITESVPLHLIPGYRSVSPHFLTSPDKHLSSSDSNIGQAPVTRLDASHSQTLSGSSSSSSVDNTSSSSSSYKQLSTSSSHLTTTASTASPSLRSYNNTDDNTSTASTRVESTVTSTSSSLRIDNTPTASSTVHNNTSTASPSTQTEHSNTPVTKLSRVGQLQRQFLQNDQAASRDQQTTGVGVRRWHSLPPQESRPTVIKRDKSALPAPKLPTMPSYDDITDEEELHKLMNSTEDFEERKKIRSRLREIRDKQREDYEAKRKQREAEAEDLVKKKFEKAEEEKKKKMEAYKQQAPTHERESKYHEISQSLITDKHKAAEDEKAAKLAVYSHIAESTGPGGEKTVTKTTTTSSSEKTPGGTRTTTTTTKTETSTKSFGGTSYGKPAEETAQELTQRLMSASGPGVSGRITVKTESWNSADGKVQKSEKMQTWGAKPQSAMAAFKQMDNANAPAGGVKPNVFKQVHFDSGLVTVSLVKRAATTMKRNVVEIKEEILNFCRANTAEYENVEITNFSSSWNNGMAFCALIHHFFPNAFDFSALDPTKRRYNFTLAFDTAEKEADIAPLLDVDDMVKMKNPDWKCVFTYVQSIYRHLKDHEKNKTAAVEQ